MSGRSEATDRREGVEQPKIDRKSQMSFISKMSDRPTDGSEEQRQRAREKGAVPAADPNAAVETEEQKRRREAFEQEYAIIRLFYKLGSAERDLPPEYPRFYIERNNAVPVHLFEQNIIDRTQAHVAMVKMAKEAGSARDDISAVLQIFRFRLEDLNLQYRQICVGYASWIASGQAI